MIRILVTTIKRGYPVEESGCAYIVDWERETIINKIGMLPLNAKIPRNPRGGIRGLRGACKFKEYILIATNDTVSVLDRYLELRGTINNKYFCNLHELKKFGNSVYAVSCGKDCIVDVISGYTVLDLQPHSSLGLDNLYNRNIRYDNIDRHGVWRPNSIAKYKGNFIISLAAENRIVSEQCDSARVDIVPSEFVDKPHSVRVIGDDIYFASSSKRTVFRYVMDYHDLIPLYYDEKPFWFRDTELNRWGWLRGMDIIDEENFFVGSSPYARIINFDRKGNKKGEMKLSNVKSESVSEVVVLDYIN